MKFIRYLKFLFMFLLLAFILMHIDLRHTLTILKKTNLFMFIAALSGIIPLYLLKAFRFKYLLGSNGINYSLKDSLMVFFISNFIGFITPARLGEFVKAYYVAKDCDIKLVNSISVVLLDRIFDLIVLLVFAIISILIIPTSKQIVGSIMLLTVLIAIIIVIIFLSPGWLKRIKFINKFAFSSKFTDMREALEIGVSSSVNAATITILAYMVLFLQSFFLAKSLDLPLGYFYVCAIMALVNLLSFLPISVSGIGTREAAMIYFFSAIDLSSELAVVYAFLNFILFNVIGGLLGFLLWFIKPVGLKEIKTSRHKI